MDESTSALDELLQQKCLRACIDHGMTMISVVHRPTAIPYHDQLLVFKPETGWVVEDLPEEETKKRHVDIEEEAEPAAPAQDPVNAVVSSTSEDEELKEY